MLAPCEAQVAVYEKGLIPYVLVDQQRAVNNDVE